MLAYSVDFDGDEMYTIRVMDLETRDLLADEIPNTYYSLEWANDNATFFYTMLDAAKRPHQVYRHTLGEKREAADLSRRRPALHGCSSTRRPAGLTF